MPKTLISRHSTAAEHKLSPFATLLIVTGFSLMAWGLIIMLVFG
jgi:hypothetical protein